MKVVQFKLSMQFQNSKGKVFVNMSINSFSINSMVTCAVNILYLVAALKDSIFLFSMRPCSSQEVILMLTW